MAEIDKIKTKIFHLLAKTVEAGCTEAEAMTAAEKAGELMDHYCLSISDIQIKQIDCKHVKVVLDTVIGGTLHGCIGGIAKYCDCKCWFSRGRKQYKGPVTRGATYHFFGLEPDAMMAEYLYKVIDAAFDTELKRFKKSDAYHNTSRRKAATASFKVGFSSGIVSRLLEMKREREAELANRQREERTGRNLVVVKMEKVEEDFEELGVHLNKGKKGARRCSSNWAAYGAGQTASDRVNLNKAMTGESTTALIS